MNCDKWMHRVLTDHSLALAKVSDRLRGEIRRGYNPKDRIEFGEHIAQICDKVQTVLDEIWCTAKIMQIPGGEVQVSDAEGEDEKPAVAGTEKIQALDTLPTWAQGIGLPKGPGVPADPALFVSVVRAIDAVEHETYWLKAKSIIFLYMQDISITPAVAAKILSFLAEKTGVIKRIQTPRGAQFAIVPQNKHSEKA